MAAPSGQLKASRYFVALAAILAVLYALVFFTGNKKPTPKLGLDLQGGTSMILEAKLPNGGVPDKDKMEQARAIIADRVNLTGVAEPEVVREGKQNIVVNIAGTSERDELKKLVQPAEMRFRKVLNTTADTAASVPTPSASASTAPSGSAAPAASSAAPAASGSAAASAPASAAASAPASPAASAPASASATPSETPAPVSADILAQRDQVKKKLGQLYQAAEQLPDPTSSEASTDPSTAAAMQPFADLKPEEIAALPADMQFKVPTISCAKLNARPVGSIVDPTQKVVACEETGKAASKYLLDVAKVLGDDVKDASFANDPSQGWKVNLSFKGGGQDKWTNLTKEAYDNGAQKQVAIVLDNLVVSAPSIKGVITADAEITGKFTKDEVQTLSRQLKYGSLPMTFEVQSTEDVTATLGTKALKAGLLAGGIGLALVIVYCLVYYRALGFVVIASLGVSAGIIYAMLVVLGRQMGFTLSLAGVAGFIVSIGITADSFVVFFERLKDEVKDAKTVRSAVPRAWVRARRTILSADTVSFLAAAILYILAVGPVKGFAFTLGMSTIIDLVVVFLFTHPLVAMLSRFNAFTTPRVSGLGNLRSDRAVAVSAARLGAVRTKES